MTEKILNYLKEVQKQILIISFIKIFCVFRVYKIVRKIIQTIVKLQVRCRDIHTDVP